MDLCSAAPQGAGFISSVSRSIDCQARLLGSGGWAALAAPGSPLSLALTGILTIFVALVGYNLLLGGSMTVRSGTLALVKVGAVLALTTSWPAYRALVYDLVIDGPSELVSAVGRDAGVVGSDGTLEQHLDEADRTMAQLATLGAGNAPQSSDQALPPQPFGGFDIFALGGSRMLFELTAVGGFGVVRIISGLMLALGPFFVAFLLFDGTRSLFEGWIRVLCGTGLGAAGVSISLGLELALLEPWLASAVAARTAGYALPTMPAQLFVLATMFALMTLAALWASVRLASGFRLPAGSPIVANPSEGQPIAIVPLGERAEAAPGRAETGRSRATAIAGALAASVRRESAAPTAEVRAIAELPRPNVGKRDNHTAPLIARTGRAFTRAPGSRVSARANKRDAAR